MAHWLSPSFGADFRLEPDLDRIEALSTERAALWARVDAASFLDRNEKRTAVGYGEVEGEQADIAVSDSVDEAGVDEGDVEEDPQAEINKLKAKLYDLQIKYEGQPRGDAGRFSFGRGSQNNTQRPRSGGSSKPTSSGNTLVAFAPIQGIGSTSMNDALPQNAILSSDEANLNPHLVQLTGSERYTVDIEKEPESLHYLKRHVGRSDSSLIDELSKSQIKGLFISFVKADLGSYHTLEDAKYFANQTLQRNTGIVDRVASGQEKEFFIVQRFGYETGKEAHRDSGDTGIYIRKTYEVGVGIYHNPRSKTGYSIYTTYPYNRRTEKDK